MMEKYGLILNFFGALLLAWGSSLMTDVTSKIIDTIAADFGTWSTEKIELKLIKDFRQKKILGSWLNRIGYLLFIVGFALQLSGLNW